MEQDDNCEFLDTYDNIHSLIKDDFVRWTVNNLSQTGYPDTIIHNLACDLKSHLRVSPYERLQPSSQGCTRPKGHCW